MKETRKRESHHVRNVAVAGGALLGALCAMPSAAGASPRWTYGEVDPASNFTRQYERLCTEAPRLCSKGAGHERPVALPDSPELRALLNRVNHSVNERITAAPDEAFDTWRLPAAGGAILSGDCEKYVLLKKQELLDEGVDGSALSLVLVVSPSKNIRVHMVLAVAIGNGDDPLILDNLNTRVLPLSRTGLIPLRGENGRGLVTLQRGT